MKNKKYKIAIKDTIRGASILGIACLIVIGFYFIIFCANVIASPACHSVALIWVCRIVVGIFAFGLLISICHSIGTGDTNL